MLHTISSPDYHFKGYSAFFNTAVAVSYRFIFIVIFFKVNAQ